MFFCCLFICKRLWIIFLGWKEGATLSAVVYLLLCGFSLKRFPLSLGACDGIRYFIVTFPSLLYNY